MKVNGNGSVYEVKPGVYQYRFNLGRDSKTGKYAYSPKRTLHCKTKNKRGREAELRAALEDYKRELETGLVVARGANYTVGEYAESFHELRKGAMRSALSWERERYDVEHIKELFGDVRLKDLKAPIIKQVYARVRETGRFTEGELHKIHAKLRQIMQEALEDELISKNPCSNISIPRPKAQERQALSSAEASRLSDCLRAEFELKAQCEDDAASYQGMSRIVGVMLLLDTGMRRGEMLGLDWCHLDLEKGIAHVTRQFAKDKVLREPKSEKSKRYLHLGFAMVEVLRRWKMLQAAYFRMIGRNQADESPVVNNDLGGNVDPDGFNRWLRKWCVQNGFGEWSNEPEAFYDSKGRKRYRKTGYKGLTPHMLRHTQATLLIGANTDIKTVQSRLGHASADMTINTYSHAIAEKEAEAAKTFSELLEDSK